MAAFTTHSARAAARQNSHFNGNRRQDDNFTPSVHWANIGVTLDILNPETGEYEPTFVSIGGVPLDNLKLSKVTRVETRGSAIAFEKLHLYEQVMQAVSALEPGEEKAVLLEVRLRKANEDADISKMENEMVRNRPALFAAE